MLSRGQGVLLQIIGLDYLQNHPPNGAGYRVAAVGVEVLHAVVEGGGDALGGDYRRQRVAVSDRFAQRDDVGDDLLGFKPPEVRADTAKADLNFVGYADPAGRLHFGIELLQIARRQHHLAAVAEQRFKESIDLRIDKIISKKFFRYGPGNIDSFNMDRMSEIIL